MEKLGSDADLQLEISSFIRTESWPRS